MIRAQQKPLSEIQGLLGEAGRVLVLGCGTCVAVSFAGGEKEARTLAGALRVAERIAGRPREVRHAVTQRQCEPEFVQEVEDDVAWADLVVSTACGIGCQVMNERYPEKLTVPGINTCFLGAPVEHGVFDERCQACGDCILDTTAGICPIARCAKSMLNGPCGGSQDGHCEVNPEVNCAWQLIYDRLAALGRLDLMNRCAEPKDWRSSRDGGQRRIVREDLRL
ncbi:MAG: hypothetical protein HPY83_16915 [Anaerolineae bacterium]|nr:hypothetical protein [Anaerolineae bacterium]